LICSRSSKLGCSFVSQMLNDDLAISVVGLVWWNYRVSFKTALVAYSEAIDLE